MIGMLHPVARPLAAPFGRALAARAFSWRNLFADGTPGFRINIEEALRINAAAGGDLSKCVAFQDSAGTLPVTAMEQPLGLILDTKLGVPVRGVEHLSGEWEQNFAWTQDGGDLVCNATTNTYTRASLAVPLDSHSWYEVRINIKDYTSGNIRTRLRGGTLSASPQLSGVGQRRFLFYSDTNTIFDLEPSFSIGFVGRVGDISVKKIPGHHFVQPSNTPSRPIVSRRVNRLVATEDIASTAWIKRLVTVEQDGTLAPDGTSLADKIVATGDAGTHDIYQLVNPDGGKPHDGAVYLKSGGYHNVTVHWNGAGYADFNLADGTTPSPDSFIEPVGGGWYRCGRRNITRGGINNQGYMIRIEGESFVGDGTSGIYIWGADLRLSIDANLPQYQRVTAPTDYDESGFPAYAKFDGVDDWLETAGAIDLTSTDEVTVLAGCSKLSDANPAVLIASGGGVLGFRAPVSAAVGNYNWRSGGTITPQLNVNTYPAPQKSLLVGYAKVATDLSVIRVDGQQVAISSADQGDGNLSASKWYVGSRTGYDLFFNGRIYGVTVVGKLLTDSQLAAAERAERNLGRLY